MGGAGAVCQPYTYHHPPRTLAPCLPTPRAGRRPSAVGSHVLQRGEAAELRGHVSAQAVVIKVPACERGTSRGGERGEREGVQGHGSVWGGF